MNFMTAFQISANKKDDSYNLILVITDQLSKIVYYELVRVMIDIRGLRKEIINVIVY